jgi:hypothetical protein
MTDAQLLLTLLGALAVHALAVVFWIGLNVPPNDNA